MTTIKQTTNKNPKSKSTHKPTIVLKQKIPITENMTVCSSATVSTRVPVEAKPTDPEPESVSKFFEIPKTVKPKVKPKVTPKSTTVATVEPTVSAGSKAVTKKATSPPPADYMKRSRFTREMALRSLEDGVSPKDMLMAIAVDPSLTFTDWLPLKGQLVEIERTATLSERIDCAKSVLPYFDEKKGVKVEHGGAIQILHSLASTALDDTILDSMGKVVDIEDIEFEDVD
jgi:hypothetical protein